MEARADFLIHLIDNKSMFFLVPLYQRKYNWKKDIINELIEDLEEFMKEKKTNSYFLGTIVIKKDSKMNSQHIIVDGQQRITTLFLMCSALCDLLKSKKEESSTLFIMVNSLLESNNNKFKLTRINDENIMRKIIKGNAILLDEEECKSSYYVVYNIFKKFFTTKIKKGIKELESFYENAIKKIKIAVINLEQNEDELLIYQSINSKGKFLSSADLIKSYVMQSLNLIDDKKIKESQILFENNFINKLNEKEISDLIRETLAIETGTLFTKSSNKLYLGFKKEFSEEKIDRNFIENMIYDLKIYKYIEKNMKKNIEYGNKSLPLLKSQLMNFYSIIHLSIKENSNFEDQELVIKNKENIRYVIDYLSKLVVARTLCSFGRVEGNREYAKLSQKLKNELAKNELVINNFKNIFNEIIINHLDNTNNKYKMPTKNEIKKDIMKKEIYSNKSILKWILIAIEQNITKNELNNSEKITIEHIYPQNPNVDWYNDLSNDEILKINPIKNTFGNLSITHAHHNSFLSNRVFKDKKEILADKSYLKINKILYEENKWNYDAIKNRTEKLLKKIFDLWWH